MLKNKFKTLLILMLMISLTFCPLVKADDDDEIIIEDEVQETSEEYAEDTEQETTTSESIEENSKSEDVYLCGDEITIDYIVDGNAFVMANTVNITSKIGGDLFVLANTVNIENGYVYSNVFVAANTVNLNGVIYDLYATCNTLNIGENGYVYRDMHAISENINLYGTVGRNAFIDCQNLSLSKEEDSETISATIYGDLNYSNSSELEISDEIVNGNINFSKKETKSNSWVDIVLSIITSIVFTVLVYLALLWLAPKFKNKLSNTLTKEIGPIIGFGALAIILIPIIALALLLTQIGASAALVIVGIYAILLAVSSSIFIIAVSEIASEKSNVNNKFATLGIVAGITLIVSLLKLVPYASGLVTLICVWTGTGIIVKQLLPSKKEKA